MTSSEFKKLIDNLRQSMPDLGSWVISLGSETLQHWYTQVFASLDYEHCLTVNRELLRGDHDVAGFKRDRLCGVYIKREAELVWNRKERVRERQEARRTRQNRHRSGSVGRVSSFGILEGDPIMGPAYREVLAKMDAYRRDNDESHTPGHLISQWTEEALEKFDTTDATSDQSYRCLTCRDTSFSGETVDGIRYAGPCPDCEAGRNRMQNISESFRKTKLGYGPSSKAPDENQFNEALQS